MKHNDTPDKCNGCQVARLAEGLDGHHLWQCKMCSHLHAKLSAGVPKRSCPNCGCRFEDRNYWRFLRGGK